MNEDRIKRAVYSAIDDRISVLKKFLEAEIFSLWDLCYWWDPNKSWNHNAKYAENVLQVLIEEKCCYAIGKVGGQGFVKTEAFVVLLKTMLKRENQLKKWGIS